MLTRYYPSALRIVGCIVAVCSAISALLLGTAPPPDGLTALDPAALRTVAVVVLIAFGVALPVAVLLTSPLKQLLLKAGAFAFAAFANAMTLSPLLSVPFQDTTALIVVMCGLVMATLSVLAYMDSVQRKTPQSKF
ncbi:hypothetical protein [Arthrobacter sp. CJ23]|uniref:hypothetical protein n=1 Tax=Arthrobacter sp. CJ23 TaxID=2972479 RepID=UPI00215D3F6E|nr:hypothetical protein [Arthrobacter sp. CJ23]UVJ40130.1 hypothetical protein NVV90_02760 [Arthrobacter sp. CJ23]